MGLAITEIPSPGIVPIQLRRKKSEKRKSKALLVEMNTHKRFLGFSITLHLEKNWLIFSSLLSVICLTPQS